MLCSAAPEKVSALNLKRLKADNKTCGQSQENPCNHTVTGIFLISSKTRLKDSQRFECRFVGFIKPSTGALLGES